MLIIKAFELDKGSSSSGDFGHAGRPGKVGGENGKGIKCPPEGRCDENQTKDEKPDDSDILIVEESDRRFEAWGAVNVIDRVGELVPVEQVEKLMPIYMKRGGILMDSHSGRHVGRVEKWEKRFNEKVKADGIYLFGCIYKDLKIDDAIWNFIKSGTYKGISIGGQDFGKKMSCDQSRCFNEIEDMEFWEFSIVENPMNKAAWLTTFNKLAKSDEPEPKLMKSWKTREKLADLEHEQWCEWSKDIAENEKISKERNGRWNKLWIPYQELSETEKESDRKYADKVIDIVYGKSNSGLEIKKNIVVPDPTFRGRKDEKIVDHQGTPSYIAPLATVGSPLAESEKRKELLSKLIKKADSCGYIFKEK